MNDAEAKARAQILKALGHPTRLRIVDELSRGDRCGSELQPLLGVDQSVVSRHLSCLKQAGLVTEHKEGLRGICHLAAPCILRALDCTLQVLREVHERQTSLLHAGSES